MNHHIWVIRVKNTETCTIKGTLYRHTLVIFTSYFSLLVLTGGVREQLLFVARKVYEMKKVNKDYPP